MATTRLRIPPVSDICGKYRFHDPGKAQVAADQLRERNKARGESDGMLTTYWCRACGAWHVGHVRSRHARLHASDSIDANVKA
jgi:hypothetical protein